MGREGFEPPKAEPANLQSAPFGHLGTCPKREKYYTQPEGNVNPSAEPCTGSGLRQVPAIPSLTPQLTSAPQRACPLERAARIAHILGQAAPGIRVARLAPKLAGPQVEAAVGLVPFALDQLRRQRRQLIPGPFVMDGIVAPVLAEQSPISPSNVPQARCRGKAQQS